MTKILILVAALNFCDEPYDFYYFDARQSLQMVEAAMIQRPQDRPWLSVLRKQMVDWKKDTLPGDPMPWGKQSFEDFRRTFPDIVRW